MNVITVKITLLQKNLSEDYSLDMSLNGYTKMSPCRIPIVEPSPTKDEVKTSCINRVGEMYTNKTITKLSSKSDVISLSSSGFVDMALEDEEHDLSAPYSPSDFESIDFT